MPPRLSIDEYKSLRAWQAEADADRATFLERLDASALLLTEWETEFVGNYMQARSEGRWQNWFTPGRRASTDAMREKYGVELNLPPRSRTPDPRPETPSAAPGCCMYLANEPGHPQQPCNEPATCQTRNGFRYCRTHHDIAADACRRKKVPFNVQPFHKCA